MSLQQFLCSDHPLSSKVQQLRKTAFLFEVSSFFIVYTFKLLSNKHLESINQGKNLLTYHLGHAESSGAISETEFWWPLTSKGQVKVTTIFQKMNVDYFMLWKHFSVLYHYFWTWWMKCRQFESRTLMHFDLERSNGGQRKKIEDTLELIYNTDLKRLVSKIYLLSLSYIVVMQSCSTK